MPNEIRNLAWLRKRTAKWVQFDPDEADEAFSGPQGAPWETIDEAINETYKTCILDAAERIDPDYFKFSVSDTWPAADVSRQLPASISRTSLLYILDITNGLPGIKLEPTGGYNGSSEIYWSGMNVLTWGSVGPGGDSILQFTYRAVPQELVEPLQEPDLLPYEFRDMLHIGAAIKLREEADEDNVPDSWRARYAKWDDLWRSAINQSTSSGTYGVADNHLTLP